MPGIQVTYPRAIKIWWSFAWRSFVLLTPAMFAMAIAMFLVFPFPKPGEPISPDQAPAFALRGFAIWIVAMAANVLLQVQAMRWMLKTRWSDFRLQAISED